SSGLVGADRRPAHQQLGAALAVELDRDHRRVRQQQIERAPRDDGGQAGDATVAAEQREFGRRYLSQDRVLRGGHGGFALVWTGGQRNGITQRDEHARLTGGGDRL